MKFSCGFENISSITKRKNYHKTVLNCTQNIFNNTYNSANPISTSNTQNPMIRFMSSLTHVTKEGKASMVDVGHKQETERSATAKGTVFVGEEVANLIKENLMKKGDVLTIAQLAGTIGAKKTSDLIPLCHNILLNHVKIEVKLNEECDTVDITCSVKCKGKTGVEMEALTGVSIAALTVYDMCKAVTHKMVIKEIFLLEKTGGSRGSYNI